MITGTLIGLIVWLWLATLRVRSAAHPALDGLGQSCWVLAHWHGQIMPLLAHRWRRATVAMVSRSADGDRMVAALRWFGVRAVRGSSSRGGREGLAAMVAVMAGGADGVLAVDGPRGPRHVAKGGAIAAAERSGGVVVPFAAHCERAWIVGGSWDRFEIPLPFSRVRVVLGRPLPMNRDGRRIDEAELAAAIHRTQQDARRLVSRAGDPSLPWSVSEKA